MYKKYIIAVFLLFFISYQSYAQNIKIMSYNTHHSEQHNGTISIAAIADKIISLEVDIVLLQEVDNKTQRTNNIDQTAEIAKLAGLNYYQFGPFFNYDGGQYGMAIISRYPIIDTFNIPLEKGAEPRTSLMATIDINGKKINVAGIHLYRSLEERTEQAKGVINYFSSSKLPLVISGDFNTTTINSSPTKQVNTTIDHSNDSNLIQLLNNNWIRLKKEDNNVSFLSGNMWDDDGEGQVEIDHTFIYNLNLKDIKKHYLSKGIVSDHRPLITEIEI